MKHVTYLWTFLFGIMWLLVPSFAAAEKWPIKEFQVIKKGPGDWLESENPVSDNTAREIERWLKTVAAEYERMGFNKPYLTDIGTFSGVEKYKVYVYPFPKGGFATYSYNCGEERDRRIHVNSKGLDPSGFLETKIYQDLAHELFHAVQHGYDLISNHCYIGDWIIEGTAEAVGIEMARKLYPKRGPADICQVGMRLYSRQLYTHDKKKKGDFPCEGEPGSLDYAASSFWQFLGEYRTRKGINIATPEFAPPDFRYLHNFFNTSHTMGTPSTEYAWLDKALHRGRRYGKHQFAIRLHTAYARFVGTFSSYWKHKRRNHYPGGVGGPPAEKERKWMEWIFGKCEEITASATLAMEISPIASRCIKMHFDFSGRVNLTFFATGENQSVDLDSLAISTDGGKKIIRRHPAESHPDKIGKFTLEAKAGTPQYFIVSNVQRKDPGNTKVLQPIFSIVPELMSTSMAKAKKKEQPSADPTAPEELINAWESRSWKGFAIQKMNSPCTWPFEARPCGPLTRIELQLLPDTAQMLDEIDDSTMSMERRMRVLDAIVKKGEEHVPTDIVQGLKEIREEDGWRVGIKIPQIQPGFTGTVSNAHIRVEKAIRSDGSANGAYRAIGPGWVGPCKGPGLKYHPSSGQVEISEFTKNNLRGTFSARLVDQVKACQSAPIATTISGSFSITSINWGQAAPELSEEEILDQTIEETNELLPGFITDDMREYIKEKARKEGQKQEQSQQEKAENKKTSVWEQCDCRCEMKDNFCALNPTAECCVLCQPLFKACKGHAPGHSSVMSAEEQAAEETEVQTMRQQYEDYLESHGLGGNVKIQMMQAFDDLQTLNEKKLFMMSLPK